MFWDVTLAAEHVSVLGQRREEQQLQGRQQGRQQPPHAKQAKLHLHPAVHNTSILSLLRVKLLQHPPVCYSRFSTNPTMEYHIA